METSGRVVNKSLNMKILFGRAKTGYVFSAMDKFLEYVSDVDNDGNVGQGLSFSQSEVPDSPFICHTGNKMREDNHSYSTKGTELITKLYRTESCCLYYGFFNEHIDPFLQIIGSHNTIHKDKSIFKRAISEGIIPSNDELEEYMLAVFVQYHKNDVPDKVKPERNKYPPNHEDLIVVPLTNKEWKQKNT